MDKNDKEVALRFYRAHVTEEVIFNLVKELEYFLDSDLTYRGGDVIFIKPKEASEDRVIQVFKLVNRHHYDMIYAANDIWILKNQVVRCLDEVRNAKG